MAKDKFEALSDGERSFRDRLFSLDLAGVPSEFKTAVLSWIDLNPGRVSDLQVAGLKGEEWIAVSSFSGTWVNFDATRVASYYKDATGRVHLEGVIKSGTIGTAAFTLPEGYRPRNGTKSFVVDSNAALGQVTVSTAGVVTPTVGNNAYVFLDGISFRAA